jgi:hypothetical protein
VYLLHETLRHDKDFSNELPRINLANGGSMQSAEAVTLNLEQRNRFLGRCKIANTLNDKRRVPMSISWRVRHIAPDEHFSVFLFGAKRRHSFNVVRQVAVYCWKPGRWGHFSLTRAATSLSIKTRTRFPLQSVPSSLRRSDVAAAICRSGWSYPR